MLTVRISYVHASWLRFSANTICDIKLASHRTLPYLLFSYSNSYRCRFVTVIIVRNVPNITSDTIQSADFLALLTVQGALRTPALFNFAYVSGKTLITYMENSLSISLHFPISLSLSLSSAL